MLVAGCDIGSLTAKAVVLSDGNIIGSAVIQALPVPQKSAELVMEKVLENTGLTLQSIDKIMATGYGRNNIDFAHCTESEITCHARGAIYNDPEIKTVIDIGGQDAKVIKINNQGKVDRYIYNDKCASGSGRFLEIIAEAMDITVMDMSQLDSQSKNQLTLSNQCVIFAETEIISLLNDGKEITDIVNALHRALAGRVASLAKGLGIQEKIILTGGVAKNEGMKKALEHVLSCSIVSTQYDPQINGALGAALLASSG
jgi:(R)-2-hydroxyacyl-CoA dehydratese activating ATPase